MVQAFNVYLKGIDQWRTQITYKILNLDNYAGTQSAK